MTKSERNPNDEIRNLPATAIHPSSDFGLRRSFGFRRGTAGSFGIRPPSFGFTLIELILVMTVLTIAASITAPQLANFFRGRTLDSEARRLLALIRQGQNRAVSEGLPIDLWLDTQNGTYGLEAVLSYETQDPRAMNFTMDSNIHIELGQAPSENAGTRPSIVTTTSSASVPVRRSNHPNLPAIRFLPDDSFG